MNIGPTIALEVKVEAKGCVTFGGLQEEESEYADLAIATLLKPDQRESSWIMWPLPERWEDEVIESKIKITFTLIGEIRFEDVFGTIHSEEFSYRMNVYKIERLPRHFVQLGLMRNWHPFSLHPENLEF